MTLLCRLVVVCLFALFAVRGTSACEPMSPLSHSVPPTTHAMRMASGHCHMADHPSHNSHGACHASCCIAGCCGHCGAPPLAFHFDTHASGRATLAALTVALRAGITHAPPLPPPIA